jgi:hypothetical protein
LPQTSAETGVLPCHSDSLVGRGFVDHQAGRCEDALLMGADNGFVDGFRASKIIGVDDQAALWGAIAHAGGETVERSSLKGQASIRI